MAQRSITPFDYAALDLETRVVVQQRTSEIKSLMKRSAQDIIEIGGKFAEVRDLLKHNKTGGFQGWFEAEGWQYGTVYNFIHVHEAFGNIPNFGKLDIVLSALYKLASPSTPEKAREEVLQLAAEGQKVTTKDTQQIIAAHKPQPAPAPKPAEPPKHWMDTLIIGKHYPVDRKRGLVVNEPFDNVQECRAAYPGLIPESRAFLLMNRVAFATYRFVAPDRLSPTPEAQPLHAAGVDDSTSPDEPTTPRHDPRAVSNTGEWTPGETAYMNRAQAAINHAHPGKMPFVGNPIDEVARLKARIAELESENARLVAENIQLRGENVSLRNRMQLSDVKPPPAERIHQ